MNYSREADWSLSKAKFMVKTEDPPSISIQGFWVFFMF
ncbi:hypothetical protein F383_32023 [Gossypium arboreum]|uniref:Uncharacterized protein n=1 Tax=Gossypium arboreum TaxID=29729 RepID=A0A0B0N442_GOSAR|nr:hypothetical protein F383_32023 [Gossypium arboreum]